MKSFTVYEIDARYIRFNPNYWYERVGENLVFISSKETIDNLEQEYTSIVLDGQQKLIHAICEIINVDWAGN